MGKIIPRMPLETIPSELRTLMDHAQPHVVLFDLAIACGPDETADEKARRDAALREWEKLQPEIDDSCPF